MLALLNEVTDVPVVVLVTVEPPVTTAVPVAATFEPHKIEYVTLGVAVPPGKTAVIFDTVMALDV